MKIDGTSWFLCDYINKALRSPSPTMPKKMPKKIARSQLKRRIYDSLENHWYTMIWEDEYGSSGAADLWWEETIEWLENVPLEKINPAIPFPQPLPSK